MELKISRKQRKPQEIPFFLAEDIDDYLFDMLVEYDHNFTAIKFLTSNNEYVNSQLANLPTWFQGGYWIKFVFEGLFLLLDVQSNIFYQSKY